MDENGSETVRLTLECAVGHARTMRCLECCSYAPVHVANKAFNSSSKSLTFGQCDLALFAHIMHTSRRIRSAVAADGEDLGRWEFVDLGSGMGRIVFAAHLLCSFRKSVGIELVHNLHVIAQAKLEAFYQQNDPTALAEEKEEEAQRIRFVHGDILEEEWWEAGEGGKKVVFITSTCFTDDLFERVARKASGMAQGGWLVSFTKEVPPSWGLPFILQRRFSRVKVNWGSVTVFLYKKES